MPISSDDTSRSLQRDRNSLQRLHVMSTADHDSVETLNAYLAGLQVLNFQVPASGFFVIFGRLHAEHFVVELDVTSKVEVFGVQLKILMLWRFGR